MCAAALGKRSSATPVRRQVKLKAHTQVCSTREKLRELRSQDKTRRDRMNHDLMNDRKTRPHIWNSNATRAFEAARPALPTRCRRAAPRAANAGRTPAASLQNCPSMARRPALFRQRSRRSRRCRSRRTGGRHRPSEPQARPAARQPAGGVLAGAGNAAGLEQRLPRPIPTAAPRRRLRSRQVRGCPRATAHGHGQRARARDPRSLRQPGRGGGPPHVSGQPPLSLLQREHLAAPAAAPVPWAHRECASAAPRSVVEEEAPQAPVVDAAVRAHPGVRTAGRRRAFSAD
jgi:hypothetical protein